MESKISFVFKINKHEYKYDIIIIIFVINDKDLNLSHVNKNTSIYIFINKETLIAIPVLLFIASNGFKPNKIIYTVSFSIIV